MQRKGLLSILIISVGLIFLVRLFYLQILENPYKTPTLNSSTVKIKYDYPERGYIYDRNGVLLVANHDNSP